MDEVELPASSSSTSAASASTTMRSPNSFSEPSIDEWRVTIPLAPAGSSPSSQCSSASRRSSHSRSGSRFCSCCSSTANAHSWIGPRSTVGTSGPSCRSGTCFRGHHSRHRLRAGIFTAGLTIACAGRSLLVPRLDSRPIYRPRSARPRLCCRDCFGGNASGAGSGVSRREQVA